MGLGAARVSSNTIVALLVNSSLTIVLFDSSASHSFIAYQCTLKNTLLVNSPRGEMQANLKCPIVELILKAANIVLFLVWIC